LEASATIYEVVATPTFKLCLDRLVHFLEIKYASQKAQKTKLDIKEVLAENLSQNPHIAPISNRLIDIGIRDFRQYPVGDHNMVFYRIDETRKRVVLIAVMDSRQSIQKLLQDILLLS
jgi:plasmid stabilization system protein ParE